MKISLLIISFCLLAYFYASSSQLEHAGKPATDEITQEAADGNYDCLPDITEIEKLPIKWHTSDQYNLIDSTLPDNIEKIRITMAMTYANRFEVSPNKNLCQLFVFNPTRNRTREIGDFVYSSDSIVALIPFFIGYNKIDSSKLIYKYVDLIWRWQNCDNSKLARQITGGFHQTYNNVYTLYKDLIIFNPKYLSKIKLLKTTTTVNPSMLITDNAIPKDDSLYVFVSRFVAHQLQPVSKISIVSLRNPDSNIRRKIQSNDSTIIESWTPAADFVLDSIAEKYGYLLTRNIDSLLTDTAKTLFSGTNNNCIADFFIIPANTTKETIRP